MLPDRPAHARHLVGKRHGGLVVANAPLESQRPALDTVERFIGLGQGLGSAQGGPRPMDDQHSEVFVAALGDPAQPSSMATGALQRGDPKPGCEVASGLEVVRRAGAGDQCRAGQQPDAGDLAEQRDVFVVPGQGRDLMLGELDPVFQVRDLLEQFGEGHAQTGREVVLIDDADCVSLGGIGSGRDGMAELSQAASKPVDPSNPGGLPLLSNPMELLDLLLLDGPDRDGMDPPAAIGIEQGFGIGLVGLVAQPVLPNELGREHDRFMPMACGLTAPEMGATAGLEQDDGALGSGQKLLELPAVQPLMRERLALWPGKGDLKDLLCEIDGDESRLAHGLLLSWDIQRNAPECWHIAMPVKTREESISSLKYVPALRASTGRG